MKFSFVPQTFFRIFFLGSGSGSWPGSGFHYEIHSSWYYFEFQYQTYISYIQDTHQILFGSANSFESYCVHMKSPRTYSQTTGQTDRQTDGNFFLLVLSSKTYKTWTFVKRREFFFSLMPLQYFLFWHTPYVMRKEKDHNCRYCLGSLVPEFGRNRRSLNFIGNEANGAEWITLHINLLVYGEMWYFLKLW